MRVLVACEFSGTVRRAFRELGHDAWSCDILPAEDGGPFLSEDAAHKWVREEGESELYQRFERASVPGVSFHVEWLDIPVIVERIG
jgi:hypothetical protein